MSDHMWASLFWVGTFVVTAARYDWCLREARIGLAGRWAARMERVSAVSGAVGAALGVTLGSWVVALAAGLSAAMSARITWAAWRRTTEMKGGCNADHT